MTVCRPDPLQMLASATALRLQLVHDSIGGDGKRETLRIFNNNGTSLIQPPPTVNYFQLFDVPETFDLDARSLQRKFRQLQASFHPDLYARSASQPEQRALAELWSSHANRGYHRLRRPLDRALYLLELRGKPIGDGDLSFLADVMEANEELAEAESVSDLAGISVHNRKVLAEYAEQVGDAFRCGDLDGARELTIKMQYYSSLQDKIVEKETKLGSVFK